MKKIFELTVNKKDIEILDKYGFYYKKNFEEMIKEVAAELRAAEAEQRMEEKVNI